MEWSRLIRCAADFLRGSNYDFLLPVPFPVTAEREADASGKQVNRLSNIHRPFAFHLRVSVMLVTAVWIGGDYIYDICSFRVKEVQ